MIDKQEAKGLIHHIFKKNDTQSWISDEMFEVLFRTMDLDDSGTIEKQELLILCQSVIDGKTEKITNRLASKIEQYESDSEADTESGLTIKASDFKGTNKGSIGGIAFN